ncbi:MAG: isoprenyl transferase [Candidatus Omnitrophota bacterium]
MDRKIPHHIAIIMDGNGRWARKRGLPNIVGHRQGAKTAKYIIEACRDIGVKVLTLYTFSTENWKRPKREVRGLFDLLCGYLEQEAYKFDENETRFSVLGEIGDFPEKLRKILKETIESTKKNRRFNLNLALNYGSRAEIVRGARMAAEDVREGRIAAEDITEERFSRYLYTCDAQDPSLLIRTSGEMRLSNFLLWQLSYSEIYVTKKLWPDFKKKDLEDAIKEFQNRERRFGE